MSRCSSCKGAFPEGCSTCRPMRSLDSVFAGHVQRVTFTRAVSTEHGPAREHTCPRCMRGLPCDPSSLSSLVGQIASRQRTEADWKSEAFPSKEIM